MATTRCDWPADMTLLSATRDVIAATTEFSAAVASATRPETCEQVRQILEPLVENLAAVCLAAQWKRDRFAQEITDGVEQR